MKMTVTLFLAIAVMVIAYAWLGQGGPVAGLIFFGILLIGGILSAFGPQSSSDSKRA